MDFVFRQCCYLASSAKKKKTTVNGLFKSVFMIKYEMHIQQIFLNEVRPGYKPDHNDTYNDKPRHTFLKSKVVLMGTGRSIARRMGRAAGSVGRRVGATGRLAVTAAVS